MSIFDTYLAKRKTLIDFCNHRSEMALRITEHYQHFELMNAKMKKFYASLNKKGALYMFHIDECKSKYGRKAA